jgi:hypothetical protein
VLQFANFTATQALLDEIASTTSSCIHIIDFDLGVGGQWASFLQELAHRCGTGNAPLPMLKLTVFVSSASHNPLKLHLTRENLTQFVVDLGIPFEFTNINLDVFDPAELIAPSPNEVVVVCLPVGSSARTPSLPMLLQLVKQLAPKTCKYNLIVHLFVLPTFLIMPFHLLLCFMAKLCILELSSLN